MKIRENRILKSISIIGVGILQLFHSLMHIVQFVQSVLLLHNSYNEHDHNNFIDEIQHHPIFIILWIIVGILTLKIGIDDYIKHKRKKQIL